MKKLNALFKRPMLLQSHCKWNPMLIKLRSYDRMRKGREDRKVKVKDSVVKLKLRLPMRRHHQVEDLEECQVDCLSLVACPEAFLAACLEAFAVVACQEALVACQEVLKLICGFYHDPNVGWYYSTSDGFYYKLENGNYVLLESVQDLDHTVSQNGVSKVYDNNMETHLDEFKIGPRVDGGI